MIELIIIASLVSYSLWYFTEEDQVLSFVKRWKIWYKNDEGRKIFYPIILCPVCMGWFYYVFLFCIFVGRSGAWSAYIMLPFFALATSFLNVLIRELMSDKRFQK